MLLFRLLSFLFFFIHSSTLDNINPEAAKTAIHATDEGDDYIPWLASRRLNWNDFLSAPRRENDIVALTSTSLGLTYQITGNRLKYNITCHFSKTQSWGSLQTSYILAHEQGHFDITEIYARKLHQAMSAYKLNPKRYRKEINSIYESIARQKDLVQEQYDSETSHSRNKRVQEEWLSRIRQMLSDTEPFADYP